MDKDREKELKRRLIILKEQFKQNKIVISKDIAEEMSKSILAVRYGLDGEIDLSTVDSRVRALAMTVTAIQDREEAKETIPMDELQHTYFNFLDANFGEYYRIMVEKQLTPQSVAEVASKNPETVKTIMKGLPDFIEKITSLWEIAYDVSSYHIEDTHCLKGVYSGSTFPDYSRNIASTCGIYIDTIILPDPFVKLLPFYYNLPDEQKVYHLFESALNILKYKELALVEVSPPIVVVVPERHHFVEWEKDFLFHISDKDALIHFGRLFGRDFNDIEDVNEYVRALDTPEKVVAVMKSPNLFLLDIHCKDKLEDQIMLTLEESLTEIIEFHDKLTQEYEECQARKEIEMESLISKQLLVFKYCLACLEKSHVIEQIGRQWSVVGKIETIIHIEKNNHAV